MVTVLLFVCRVFTHLVWVLRDPLWRLTGRTADRDMVGSAVTGICICAAVTGPLSSLGPWKCPGNVGVLRHVLILLRSSPYHPLVLFLSFLLFKVTVVDSREGSYIVHTQLTLSIWLR